MISELRFSNFLRAAVAFLLVVGSFALISATKPTFTNTDKAYYADPKTASFVRPGLDIKILAVNIAQDGTMTARVKFTDPMGLPAGSGRSLHARSDQRQPDDGHDPERSTAIHHLYDPGPDQPDHQRLGRAVQCGLRRHLAGGWPKASTSTHSRQRRRPILIVPPRILSTSMRNRNLEEFDLGVDLKEVPLDFVPDGSPVTTSARRDQYGEL